MKHYFNKLWVIITVILNVVFVILFFPLSLKRVGTIKAIVFTLIGLLIIWIVYFVRAYIFSKYFGEKDKNGK